MAKRGAPVTRGTWEATLRNVRSANRRITALQERMRQVRNNLRTLYQRIIKLEKSAK